MERKTKRRGSGIVQNGLPQTHRTIPLKLPMFFGSG